MIKLGKIGQTFEEKFVRLEQFVHTYLQFQMITEEIRLSTQDATFYLEKKVREKSRECHNHKPQPFPDPKRKTQTDKSKQVQTEQMYEKH